MVKPFQEIEGVVRVISRLLLRRSMKHLFIINPAAGKGKGCLCLTAWQLMRRSFLYSIQI
jgi:hypothetical protein